MPVKVNDKRAKWDAMIAAAEKIPQECAVYIGVTGPVAAQVHEGTKITNAALATIHEFGLHNFDPATGEKSAGRMPERPFIRPSFDKNKNKYAALGDKLSEKVIDGTIPIETMLGIIGGAAAADVQNYISSNRVKPPSTPATNKRKGSTTTLVDTGVLKASITWRTGTDEPPAAESTSLSVFDLFNSFSGVGET